MSQHVFEVGPEDRVVPSLEVVAAKLAVLKAESPHRNAGRLFSLLKRAWERVACELFPADPRPTFTIAGELRRSLESLNEAAQELPEAQDTLDTVIEVMARLQPLIDSGVTEAADAVVQNEELSQALASAVRNLAAKRMLTSA